MKWFDKNSLRKLWIPAFIFVAAIIVFNKFINIIPACFKLIGIIISACSPVIIGFVFAFILFIPQNWMEKKFKSIKTGFFKNHARGVSVAVTYLVFLVAVGLLVAFIVPWIVRSFIDLIENADEYYNSALAFVAKYLDNNGKFLGIDILTPLKNFSVDDLVARFDIAQLSKWAGGAIKVGSTLFKYILSVIISAYMLLGREHLIRVIGKLFTLVFKKSTVMKMYTYLSRIASIFYSYIYSQLIDAFIVSAIMSVILTVLGIPSSLLFGLIIGISNLIPYFGSTISCALVALFVLFTDGWIMALITLALIIAAQQFDANFMQPRIVGHTIGIRPLYVLISITVCGALFGFIGILIGVPIIATVRMIILDVLQKKKIAEDNASAN